jgi:hypothetical protein
MIELNFNQSKLKAFIRDVLGCGCPEEVFERMTCRKESLVGMEGTSIDVGGRLLVFMTDFDAAGDTVKTLGSLLEAGRTKRDGGGFNRVRLVLLTAEAENLANDLHRIFSDLVEGDEKAHLHVLQPTMVPDFIVSKEKPSSLIPRNM